MGLHFILVFIRGWIFLDQENKSESRVTVQIVTMQSLAPQKAQSFIQLHGGGVSDLSLKRDLHERSLARGLADSPGRQYLICIPLYHDVESFSYQLSCDPLPSIAFSNSKHGDIASQGPPPMRFQLGDDNADQIIILIQSLSFGSNSASNL